MVHLYSIIIYKWQDRKTPIKLCSVYDLSTFGYFYRGSAREILQFVSEQVVSHSKPGDRHGVLHKEHFCHVTVMQSKLTVAVCTDRDYPQPVASSLMFKCLHAFMNTHGDNWEAVTADSELSTPQLTTFITRYQNPDEGKHYFLTV
jgi:synaptobrevin family protein YKT6